jgi:pimeloyl-ACP methyl ester carboxylesterase
MVRVDLRTALWLVTLVLPAYAGAQQAGTEIEGAWYGVTQLKPDSGLPVSVQLEVSRARDSLRVALTLPESRQIRLAIPSPYSDSSFATFREGRFHVEFTPDIGLGFIANLGIPRDDERIVFDGTLRGDALVGEIRITTFRSPITLRRGVPAKTYREIPVSFASAEDSLRLGGKLILPRQQGGGGGSRYPAVIFVTGSDPDTRDAWLYEASALAERGIASLLYDKRGVGESAGASHDLASWDDLAADVEGGIALLQSRPEIDTARIGLIGQSQGTWIIAKVAARNPAAKFIVNISGSGISAAEQETYRTGALMKRAGFTADAVARAQAFQTAKFAVARTGLGWESLDSTMLALRADSVRWFPGYGTGAAANRLGTLRLYGVLQFNYQPARDLRKIRVPTLVVMGERDVVFPPALVIEKMRQYLAEAGNTRLATRIIPSVSHGMLEVQTYRGRKFRGAISREFLATLTDWVVRSAAAP